MTAVIMISHDNKANNNDDDTAQPQQQQQQATPASKESNIQSHAMDGANKAKQNQSCTGATSTTTTISNNWPQQKAATQHNSRPTNK